LKDAKTASYSERDRDNYTSDHQDGGEQCNAAGHGLVLNNIPYCRRLEKPFHIHQGFAISIVLSSRVVADRCLIDEVYAALAAVVKGFRNCFSPVLNSANDSQ
jgi:hypothetical protein